MTRDEAIKEIIRKSDGFVPDVRPACAHFCTRMLKSVGVNIPEVNWVPSLKEWGVKTTNVKPCDLIIFDIPTSQGTTETHVGIVVDPGGKRFIHYSSNMDAPTLTYWSLDYWKPWVGYFLDMSDGIFDSHEGEDFTMIKIYEHDGKRSVYLDGKEVNVLSMKFEMKVGDKNSKVVEKNEGEVTIIEKESEVMAENRIDKPTIRYMKSLAETGMYEKVKLVLEFINSTAEIITDAIEDNVLTEEEIKTVIDETGKNLEKLLGVEVPQEKVIKILDVIFFIFKALGLWKGEVKFE